MNEYSDLELARQNGATIFAIADDGSLHVVGVGDMKPQYTCAPDRYVALVEWRSA